MVKIQYFLIGVPSTGITGTGIVEPAATPGVGVLPDGTGLISPGGTGLPVKPGTYNTFASTN